ncbi:hypothetical protein G210_5658, partial [Candida maltosa Xu316]
MEFIIDLIAERSVLRESLRIIWTIFFNRLFGPITPVTNEFMNITYPSANNLPDLNSLINDRIDRFIHYLIKTTMTRGKLIVQFLSKNNNTKKAGWFGNSTYNNKEEFKVWEVWCINVEMLPVDETSTNLTQSIQSFENNMTKVYDIVDRYKDHIPPITSLDSAPFPYKILIPEPNNPEQQLYIQEGEEGWGSYIKKILD